MAETPYRFSRPRAERTIAATRVLIASFSLYAVWLDPTPPARFAALVQACRIAKERLLGDGGPARAQVAVVGRGSCGLPVPPFRS